MSMRIINAFEVINIEKKKTQRLIFTQAARAFIMKNMAEVATVFQAGEWVMN